MKTPKKKRKALRIKRVLKPEPRISTNNERHRKESTTNKLDLLIAMQKQFEIELNKMKADQIAEKKKEGKITMKGEKGRGDNLLTFKYRDHVVFL